MEEIMKEVYFDQYCPTCRYEKYPEKCDPCCECLDSAYNENSHKPVNWKEK